MASHPKDLLTPDEYLAIERRSEFKSEYFAGETFAMAGRSKRHNLIAGNINRVLGTQLLERDCNVYNSDMRVKIASVGNTHTRMPQFPAPKSSLRMKTMTLY